MSWVLKALFRNVPPLHRANAGLVPILRESAWSAGKIESWARKGLQIWFFGSPGQCREAAGNFRCVKSRAAAAARLRHSRGPSDSEMLVISLAAGRELGQTTSNAMSGIH